MQARSALFDLYGDHLRSRGGRAPVSALVRLLAPLGIAAPAVRQAVSRMVRQGWLTPVRQPRAGTRYALTDRAVRRLDDAAVRIYRTRAAGWDGRWHLLVTSPVRARTARERLEAGLRFLGYARLAGTTWIAPRPSGEVEGLLAAAGVHADSFLAGEPTDPKALARRAWDLDALGAAYRDWLADARTLLDGTQDAERDDETAYALRSRLVHEWRKFLFTDPGLPRSLLPDDWPGDEAAAYFDTHAARLHPAATRFVDACLAPPGGT
ncbi:PaaX family transcriptional regulator C-terminal domain-containing protein [Actinopolymorpha sp. B11F2]|uniref:PaaX family transcriptional regulator n=1 Tax=Actinopolymorpha sp. B11F2 TaxID=3160862 RepID=UPI0032E4A322